MARRATTEQVAAALHVGPATVRKYAREHRLPYDTTPGGHRRFDVDEAVAAILGEPRDGASTPPEDAGGDDRRDDREDGHGSEQASTVPYVHIEPQSVVVASTVVTAIDDAEVSVYDTKREVDDWSRQTPVV